MALKSTQADSTTRQVTSKRIQMPEVIGFDHIYITVSDLEKSENFYDSVLLKALRFKKNKFTLNGDHHIQYYNRHFGFVIRPARILAKHDSYSPGLHHFCFRVNSEQEVIEAQREIGNLGINCTEARIYPDYAPDYVATFFEDPDGIRLEITNYRQERKDRHDKWDELSNN